MSLIKVVWYVLRVKNMHPGSPSDPSGTAAAEAKRRCVYSILKPHGQSFRRQVRLLLSKAKSRYVYSILKPLGQSSRSQVRPLLSKAKPSCVYSILKPHGHSSRSAVRLLLSEAKPSYVYPISKPHGQRFRNPNCCSKQHFIPSPCGVRLE